MANNLPQQPSCLAMAHDTTARPSPPTIEAPPHRRTLPNYLIDDYELLHARTASNSLDGDTYDNKPPGVSGAPSLAHDSAVLAPAAGHLDGRNPEATSATAQGAGIKRKRKLRQACVYCRRSHLVCEEARPCSRCVKRGIADRCTESSANEAAWTRGPPIEASFHPAQEVTQQQQPQHQRQEQQRYKRPRQQQQTQQHQLQQQHRQWRLSPHHPGGAASTSAAPSASYSETSSDLYPSGNSTPLLDDQQRGFAVPSHPQPQPQPQMQHPQPHPPSHPHQSMPPGSTAATETAPHPEPTSREVASAVLSEQPIFQPPSSAELDSLFSSYFFDLTQPYASGSSMAAASSGAPQPPPLPPSTSLAPGAPMHQPPLNGHAILNDGPPTSEEAWQHARLAPVHQLQPPAAAPLTLAKVAPAAHGRDRDTQAPASSAYTQTAGFDPTSEQRSSARRMSKSAPPSSVYSPYPYRKGYASLMRYMTEQRWSATSIRSVEAALSKVRKLWFEVEDAIQPPTLIQLHAEWAGNVRYYTESVLPFSPVAMLVCRKAGEVYASNRIAQNLFGRAKADLEEGRVSCYQLMTEHSAAEFFRLYEEAVESHQEVVGLHQRQGGQGQGEAEEEGQTEGVCTRKAKDEGVGKGKAEGEEDPLYWDAEILVHNQDGSKGIRKTRGVFKMKIAACGLPSLLVVCFVPL
ncbi:uncharacterized protein PFL1_06769 [Pseudozyma flocculosa PF-1]|uniref:Zn(2)-C6 fungal-type domain-containing protein n=1 Tax=Pseudozyma flocculosa PF-1 TaxID=1277687 RepID=A0A061H0I4_9BASI|nr:uncharacterized protein PFL1_06769 [Pseudozyma flocculosa PF-1]EPQ25697.1 hypothetical protein PFL1_06769 [Pseudozyma flocculosa PF-1]